MALLSRTAVALLAARCREMHPRLALFSRCKGADDCGLGENTPELALFFGHF